MHPHLGNTVKPAKDTATGTSLLHGRAAEATQQQIWACALQTEQPSHSMAGPQQQHGKQGAPGLQQISALRQQSPIFPEHPQQSPVG
mmetsp:Transcript_31708/g.66679  ORF Transcript_31708/g.66679 Transcript_31708/m.66679 type:complete len:87 (-) Transcript_31708:184-444(-)